MADAGEKIEVKNLKNTDLKPEDISKAIDDSAKALSGKAKPESPKAERKSATTENKTKPSTKSETPNNEGNQIIVKKRSGYVSPTTTTETKPAETLTKETKVDLKPPSAQGKTVVAPVPVDKTAETKAGTVPTTESKSSESTSGTKTAEEPKTEALAPAEPARTTDKRASEDENPPKQQALKTFDTTEYHLPIKPTAGKHYLNSVVSWTILLLVFIGVGGYVLNELGVIDLSQFGL